MTQIKKHLIGIMNGGINVLILCIIIQLSSCSTIKSIETKEMVSFKIVTDSLKINYNFIENKNIQNINYQIVNNTGKTLVLPINSNYFSVSKHYDIFLEEFKNIPSFKNINYSPLLELSIFYDKNDKYPIDVDVDYIFKPLDNSCKLPKNVIKFIVLKPYESLDFNTEISLPIYNISCYYKTLNGKYIYDLKNSFQIFGSSPFTGELSYEIRNWKHLLSKEQQKEFKQKQYILFEGKITSNKINIFVTK